jgi:hypothetical protein
MMHFDVNWIAVVVAAIASFAVGAAWYMALGTQWMAALGKTREQLNPAAVSPYVIGFVCQLVMAYFMALVTPALFGPVNVGAGLMAAAHMWLGFSITGMILNHRYQGQSWKLTAIDGGYLLLALLVQGLVIGLFGGGPPAPAA